jgi:gluconolactonase
MVSHDPRFARRLARIAPVLGLLACAGASPQTAAPVPADDAHAALASAPRTESPLAAAGSLPAPPREPSDAVPGGPTGDAGATVEDATAGPRAPDAPSGFPGDTAPARLDGAASGPLAGVGKAEKIVANVGFLEGPLWLPEEKVLLFYTVSGRRISKLVSPNMALPFPAAMAGVSALAPDGTLVVVGGGGRAVRIRRTGELVETLATGLSAPNDVIVRKDGTIYFTEPFLRLVKRITRDKVVSTVATMTKPNGIMLSHDQATLYVADSTDRLVKRFDVKSDGTLSTGAILASMADAAVPDGMCLDYAGNVYVTVHPGVLVFSPEGKRLGLVPLPGEEATNCSFGGEDRKALFVTGSKSLWRVSVTVPGVP